MLGVDPGQKGAVSCWAHGRYVWSKRVANTKDEVIGVLQWAKQEGERHGGLVLVLERQFRSVGKSNPKTEEVLLRSRFLWEILAEVLEITTMLVWPATWQSQLQVAPPTDDRGRKLDTKKKAIWVARHMIRDQRWSDGEADSALIARWWVRKQARE